LNPKESFLDGQASCGGDKFTVYGVTTLLRVKVLKFDRINGNDIFLVSHNQY